MLPKKGQVIYCKKCDKDLYKFNVDVQPGTPMYADTISPVGDVPVPKANELVKCHHCNSPIIGNPSFR
ncbi:hypothetical protein [Paenibacillus plantiphilus]|nr:hypothetical protein [Paenibacillus plantiphilus]